VTTDLVCDLHLADGELAEAGERARALLQDAGIIFRPW
jgi:hypothetical protein